MKKVSLFFSAIILLAFTSCGQPETVQADIVPVAETVSPEIGPAQEFGAKIDQITDTIKADALQTKTEAGNAFDTAKKNLKEAGAAIKNETSKTAAKVGTAAKEAAREIKKETNKVADNVKKAAKDVKEDLKK